MAAVKSDDVEPSGWPENCHRRPKLVLLCNVPDRAVKAWARCIWGAMCKLISNGRGQVLT